MKTEKIIGLACLLSMIAAWPVAAKDKNKNRESREEDSPAKASGQDDQGAPASRASDAQRSRAGKEPWVKVEASISVREREVIQDYVSSYSKPEKHGRRAKGLPPGLAKKAARGGELPPGWQKKCVKGEILPVEVTKQCHPLPPEVVVKLPPPPAGTILITVDGKVVRLLEATREILDVFEVRF